ncbi:NTP/NDP exchange transporter [Aerolutibacter ruishenii]|uniref:ADP,ATP carrier protein n=1 Tax=Aerolutibacter ruishenii TaxID=686800 RepID=A0A562LSN8_9GAMM|nr:Npt1/Npt2 family nucleotide transporter [Lysobacter ruishenii]TWI10651.1 AAA family ATP:ADP antiporter [Lysobacter ruishenii]
MRTSGLSPIERGLQLLATVRPGEGRAILLMVAQVFLLLLAYYLIRPLREALILAEGTSVVRSYAVGAVAVTLIFLIPLYKLLFDRLDGRGSKSTVLRWVMGFFIANLLVFCALGATGVPIGVPFFVWVGVFSVMLVAQFWAFAADLFNIRSGQRLFAIIAVGAALGAWSGSRLSAWLISAIGPFPMMLVAAALLVAALGLSVLVERSVPEGSRSPEEEARHLHAHHGLGELRSSFDVVLRSRYLLLIAVFVALINWVNSTGGFILASFVEDYAAQQVGTGDVEAERELIGQFYGDYFAWITLLQLFLQLFVVSRVLKYLGVRVALVMLPLVMVANYGLMAWMPVFALVRVTMIAENGMNYSLHGTSCHSLFLPLTREQKYVGKTTIDTFFWRFGDLLHALTIFVAVQWLELPMGVVMLFNLSLALAALVVSLLIGHHHARAVRANERPSRVPDAITRGPGVHARMHRA